MNKSLAHWDDIKQPPDNETAGTPWFSNSTYKKMQEGLKALLHELKKYCDIAKELNIEASPYESEMDRLEDLISWGDEVLKKTRSSITVNKVSWLSLRYLKAGLLLLVRNLQETSREELKKYKTLPKRILQAHDEKIKQLGNLAENGLLNGLKPAEVFFEVTDPIKEETEDRTVPIEEIVSNGESTEFEFKSTLRINVHTGNKDPRMELSCLKTIAGFLNTNGGTLVIGVSDDGTPLGIESDQFPNEDKMSLHLVNLINDRMGPQFMTFLHPRFEDYDGKRVFVVVCGKATKAVFVRDGSIERFYIRTGPATTELTASQTQSYIQQRFGN